MDLWLFILPFIEIKWYYSYSDFRKDKRGLVMGFVAAKCTECGADIEVDETREAGICKYCGTAFITEKAINNYNTHITNNNNFAGANINVIGGDLNTYIELAKIAYNSKNYSEVLNYCTKIMLIDISNADAWLLKAKSCGFESTLNNLKCQEVLVAAQKAIDLVVFEDKEKVTDEIIPIVTSQIIALLNIWLQLPGTSAMLNLNIADTLIMYWKQTLQLPFASNDVLLLQLEVAQNFLESKGKTFADISRKERFNTVASECNGGKRYYPEIKITVENAMKKNNEMIQEYIWKESPEKAKELFKENNKNIEKLNKQISEFKVQMEYADEDILKAQTLLEQNRNKLFGEGAKSKKIAREVIEKNQIKKINITDSINALVDDVNQIKNQNERITRLLNINI